MCSNQDLAAIGAALAWLAKSKAPGAAEHASALAGIMASNASQRAAMRGKPRQHGAGSGRQPTQWFSVAMGDQWATRVCGAKAAHDLVTETLTKNPGNGAPPTLGSMQVMLSKSGAWWRLVETGAGQHALEVRKCDAPD